ncbi:hypothetical protein KFL_009350025 [Klebsormidium nitens]|uniref:Uncharacterized protein n=1 Tax=Klebsormidium nitens TaxID=105231 RepID=A0A1Y1ITL4_KLENI|nr:hypothetical protein KFL_009350025 [Klebsormidium nitens]|eukprot:GAQ92156.1 hypothetical protein KFL_009350025 [Klebsormidium nitens]
MDQGVGAKDGYLKVNLEGEAGRVDVNLPQPLPDISITGIATSREAPPPAPVPSPAPAPAPAPAPSPPPPQPASPARRRESPRRTRSPSVRASSGSEGAFGIDDLVNPRKRRSPAPDREFDDGRRRHKDRRRERSPSVASRSVDSVRSSHGGRKEKTRGAHKPSPGFATLKEEKLHILLALRRMKEEGVRGITDFDPDSDIEEMRIELRAFEDDETVRTGIQSCRTALVTFSTGLEVANTKYNPFDLDMRGFSESVFERIERVVADNPDVLKDLIDRRVKEEMARAKEEEARQRQTDSLRFFDPPQPTRGDAPAPPPQKAEIGVPEAGRSTRHVGRGKRRPKYSTSGSGSASASSDWSDGGEKRKRYDSERSVSSMETVEESVATTTPRPTTVTAKATVKKVPVGKAGAGARKKVVEIDL